MLMMMMMKKTRAVIAGQVRHSCTLASLCCREREETRFQRLAPPLVSHGVSWCVMVRRGDSIPASCVQPPIASSESNPFLHTARAAERATRIHSQQRKSPRPHEPSARAPTHRRRPPRRAPAGTRSPARAPTPTRRARPSDARPRSFIVERHRGVVRHEHARR